MVRSEQSIVLVVEHSPRATGHLVARHLAGGRGP
jgi:hypothetical protein